MKSIYETAALDELLERLNKLSVNDQGKWGKMDVAQMMCHCSKVFGMASGEIQEPRMLAGRLFGFMIKSSVYNDKPFPQNLPTGKFAIISDQKEFDHQKEQLLKYMHLFHEQGATLSKKALHPFFGTYTPAQWGMAMYKHLDHHLKQFGV